MNIYTFDEFVYTNLKEAANHGRLEHELKKEEADAYILFKGRHKMPEDMTELTPVFMLCDDPFDFKEMGKIAERVIGRSKNMVYLYVTGLTTSVVECINAARRRGKKLRLCHYDNLSGGYIWQEVEP